MNCKSEKSQCCCFFGHRKIDNTEILKNTVYTVVEDLIINGNVDTFLFGSKSQFDDLCHKVVSELKEKYHHIKRIYVRAEFPYIDDNYKKYLLQKFEDTYYPLKIVNAGKAVYVERNYEIINNSKYCVVYYDKNYTPSKRKNKAMDTINHHLKSGTKLAYDYAVKKCTVINTIKFNQITQTYE